MSMSTDQRASHNQRWVPEGVRQDITWDERVQRHRESLVPKRYPTWQPDLQPESPIIQIRVAVEPAFDPVRPGLMRLYAARLAHAESTRKPVRASREGERLLVGELVDESGPLRTLALVSETRPLGRSLPAHYQHLHPAQHLQFRRFRLGRMPAGSIVGTVDPWTRSELSLSVWSRIRLLFASNVYHPRLGGSTRLLVAACAALILMLGAASTSFAAQDRYQAQPGTTVESITEEGVVDFQASFPARCLTDGGEPRSGQVVVSRPGRGGTDAAKLDMVAVSIGTGPCTAGPHSI